MISDASFKIKSNKHASIHTLLAVLGSEGACISELCLTLKDDSAKTNRRMKNKILKPTSNKKRYCVNSDTEIQIFETVKQLTIK